MCIRGSGIWLFESTGMGYPMTHHCCSSIGRHGYDFAAGGNVDIAEADIGGVELSVVGA